MSDPFYRSKFWLQLRTACFERDNYLCTVPGCTTPMHRLTADHIKRRRDGGPDTLANLRTLCAHHDAQIKEGHSGRRGNDGKATVGGCNARGEPIDPLHPWAMSRRG